VVVSTPHREDMNERMERFLNNAGFQVLRIEASAAWRNTEIAAQPIHASYKLSKKLYDEAPEADGVFVHCPRWPTIDGCLSWRERSESRWYAVPSNHLACASAPKGAGENPGLGAVDGKPEPGFRSRKVTP